MLLRGHSLTQLTVFAAAPINRAGKPLFGINRFLARNTASDAGNYLASRFGYRFATLFAFSECFAVGNLIPGPLHRVFHTSVNLVLYRPVFSPSTCHIRSPAYMPLENPNAVRGCGSIALVAHRAASTLLKVAVCNLALGAPSVRARLPICHAQQFFGARNGGWHAGCFTLRPGCKRSTWQRSR